MSTAVEPLVYQLKVVLQGISPMIWRRMLVQSNSTIADLHYILQIAMGWTDSHLHRFVIHAKQYEITQVGGLWFSDDPKQVKLSDLGLRVRERFVYEYDFSDNWQHILRVEAILTPETNRSYPTCIGGKRKAPPEDCGGAWAYLALRQQYSVGYVAERLSEILLEDVVEESLEEIRTFYKWLAIDHFDRRRVNHRLRQYATGDEDWMFN